MSGRVWPGGSFINTAFGPENGAQIRCFNTGCRELIGVSEEQIGGTIPIQCPNCGSAWRIDNPRRLHKYSVDIWPVSPFYLPEWFIDE